MCCGYDCPGWRQPFRSHSPLKQAGLPDSAANQPCSELPLPDSAATQPCSELPPHGLVGQQEPLASSSADGGGEGRGRAGDMERLALSEDPIHNAAQLAAPAVVVLTAVIVLVEVLLNCC